MCAPDRPGSGSILLRCLSSPCQGRSWPDGRCHDYSRPTTLCGWPSSRPNRQPRARQRAPTPPATPTAPSPGTLSPPTMPVWELSKPALSPSKPVLSPSKGGPRTPARRPAAPPARFTSKCRKMTQNVALFHTPTRRMSYFTSKKPHVFSPFSVILAIFVQSCVRAAEGGPPDGGERSAGG